MTVVTPPEVDEDALTGHLPKMSSSDDRPAPFCNAEITPRLTFKLNVLSSASAQSSGASSSPERVN